MEPGIEIVFRTRPARFQFACHQVLVELLYPYRKVIHQAGRTFVVERDQDLPRTKAHDFIRLVLTQYSESEHLLIEGNRTRQIADLNADVVDLGAFDGCIAGLRGRATGRGQGRETLYQLPAREHAPLEAVYQT